MLHFQVGAVDDDDIGVGPVRSFLHRVGRCARFLPSSSRRPASSLRRRRRRRPPRRKKRGTRVPSPFETGRFFRVSLSLSLSLSLARALFSSRFVPIKSRHFSASFSV
tara:strand:- start:1858 stop:2181 length:324 start_codon:yes stop_codon:yes gene_type:complete